MTNKYGRVGFTISLLSLALLASCSPKPPAARQDRQQWYQNALTKSYQSGGHTNPKWDKDAREALSDFAQIKTGPDDEQEVLSDLIGQAADNAVGAGCDDPMVRYLQVCYSSSARGEPLKEEQKMYRAAAKALDNSDYPPLFKFYADADAAGWLWAKWDRNIWPEVRSFRNHAVVDLSRAVQDKALPEVEAFQASDTLFQLLSPDVYEMTNAYAHIESALASRGIKSATPDFVRAVFYDAYAWVARGHGTADQVTPEGWQLFRKRLTLAEQALNDAWSRDPHDPEIPTEMISIILGEQKGRTEMEKWFNRAMKLDPNDYAACRAKLHYLLPQWYGSRDDMLAFGRECVANTNWGGSVPLILVDAHSEFDRTLPAADRQSYWALPDVWPDIQAAYERYAQLNPDRTRFRYPYAWYAFSCGQMDAFKKQIALIRQNVGEVNYSYFGGKAAFEKAMAVAEGKKVPTNAAPGQ